MSRLAHTIATLVITLLLPAAAAMAAASGGGSNSGGSASSDSGSSYSATEELAAAVAEIEAQDYAAAIAILDQVVLEQSGNADAHNYLGYSHRKLGNTDMALHHYKRALQIEPNHVGANEYLGELYLELGDLPKAEQRLAVLESVCPGCEEAAELRALVDAYKAQQQG
jgi:tetratricopeptide (TPR) repeat protein